MPPEQGPEQGILFCSAAKAHEILEAFGFKDDGWWVRFIFAFRKLISRLRRLFFKKLNFASGI
jgi:hypothetical protein